MSQASSSFVRLERTFHELAKSARESDSFDLNQAFSAGPRLTWGDLLKGYRTVILSEAGTGKTEEIREAAKRLLAEGKRAFFLRLEHIPEDFENAFEVSTYGEFKLWLATTEEAWLFLDSVDEARLRSPGDFERAIRVVGLRIQAASARTHVVVTGRTSAWRAKTDLQLSERYFPISIETARTTVPELPRVEVEDDTIRELLSSEDENETEADARSGFLIVSIDDLSVPQIETFARARGIDDTRTFLDEIERADAASFTTRPQDLEELIEFWAKEHRIGTRLELMRISVHRRLAERDQNHREAQPLSAVRTREGARLLAGASILGKEPTIQVPDGSYNNRGIPVQAVLPDWNDRDQLTLLARPIFDEAIYGTVRFHHRSVREYLAAEWLAMLLERSASRREVEALLFRVQYGVEVIVPTMRPILPWLAILDERIRERLLIIAPEVLFEGGDPSALPIATRTRVLVKVCDELASGKAGRSALEYAAVQRFASPDLAEVIRTLLRSYAKNEELVNFLVRMVWLGRLTSLKSEVKELAIGAGIGHYTRIAAIRALRAVASDNDIRDLRNLFVNEAPTLKRDWLGEIVTASAPTQETVSWLFVTLGKAEPLERYSVDSLTAAVTQFVHATPFDLVPALSKGFNALLSESPFVERGLCDVSEKHSWLIKPASVAVERSICGRQPESLGEDTLDILYKVNAMRDWGGGLRDTKAEFGKLVPQWPELNRAAFWHDVRRMRESTFFANRSIRLTSFWQASNRGAHWVFGVDDFDYVARCIPALPEQDDKLVALSLAFHIYTNGNRPSHWREQLRDIVKGDAELKEAFELLLNPPISEHAREERHWRKRAAEQEKRERDDRVKSKEYILTHIEQVRAPQLETPTDISNAQWYLHEILRKDAHRSNRWTAGRWRDLIPEFGEEVARAYREGVIDYWRKFEPILRSEGAPSDSTPIAVVFGLAGLDIEAAETSNWPANLGKTEVLRACRYAAHELNGFPLWFPRLFEVYPEFVGDFLLAEIRHEVETASPESESNYLLSDVSWSGQWSWDRLAPFLSELLSTGKVTNTSNLGKLLSIVQGSASVSDRHLAMLAKKNASAVGPPKIAATWFAVWVGVDPDEAITSLSACLSSIADLNAQAEFAMTFVTQMLGKRRSETNGVRRRYNTPTHLKELFLLTQRYVREEEDIDRSGRGVYSPGLRDDAQDARNSLYNLLKQIPGKEAYVALAEIAIQHPHAASRPWLASYAQAKAEEDADLVPWSPAQVRDFHEHLDRTPTNHRELTELAILRLLDLKDDLENGDDSVAKILQRVHEEPEMRNFMAHELREKAHGRYTITQEEELADDKRPDLRFHGAGFDAPVPTELKLAERWTGPKLFERLENQLSGDYLRDNRSARGIFALVNRDRDRRWQLPSCGTADFDGLLDALRSHWKSIANNHPHVEEITVVGIDLSKRFE